MRGDVPEQNNKMEANLQKMESKMDEMRGDMRAQRGEMQSMGLSLQASLEEVKGIMAAPCGGATELRGSAQCIWPAMEKGEAGMTSDATTIKREINKLGHEGTTEKLKEVTETQKIKETKSQEVTEIINEVTETEESK